MIALLDVALVGTATTLVVALVVRVSRPRPAVASLLWSVALLRFCLPPMVPAWWRPAPETGLITADGTSAMTTAHKGGDSVSVALWVGLGIVVVGAIRAFLRVRGASRKLRALEREGRPGSDRLVALVAEQARLLGVRPPRVVVSARIVSPVVAGLIRTRLLYPAAMSNTVDSRTRAAVLHELAHLARRDLVVGLAVEMASIVWWWHPAFRFARRRLDDAIEESADAVAVAAAPDARWDLAHAIVVAAAAPAADRHVAAPAMRRLSHRPEAVRRRIESLSLRWPARAGARGWCITAVVATVASSLALIGSRPPATELPWGMWVAGYVDVAENGQLELAPDSELIGFVVDGESVELAIVEARDHGATARAFRLTPEHQAWMAPDAVVRRLGDGLPAQLRRRTGRLAATWAELPHGAHANLRQGRRQVARWSLPDGDAIEIRSGDEADRRVFVQIGDRVREVTAP